MKSEELAIISTDMRSTGKFKVFNGALYVRTKKNGWIPAKGVKEFHFYNDALKKIVPNVVHTDINTIYRTLFETVEQIELQESDKTIITTPTQEIDVKTGKITPRNEDKIALSIKFDYNKDANRVEWWDESLNKVLPDEESQTAIYEMIGMSLITDKKFDVSYWIEGEGGTGKSTIILEPIQAIHHSFNRTSLEPSQWKTKDPLFYTMANKLVNISSDSSDNKKLETGVFKKLVSGEPVSADIKYLPPITFNNTALLISICNEMPIITEKSDGPFRRMIPIGFDIKIKQEDKDFYFRENIRKNKDGVIDWILKKSVEAVIDVYKRGAPTMPKKSEKKLEDIKDSNSVVRQWLKESHTEKSIKTFLSGSKAFGMPLSEAHIQINNWAKTNGYFPKKKHNNFQQLRKEIGLSKKYNLYKRNNKEYIELTNSEFEIWSKKELQDVPWEE